MSALLDWHRKWERAYLRRMYLAMAPYSPNMYALRQVTPPPIPRVPKNAPPQVKINVREALANLRRYERGLGRIKRKPRADLFSVIDEIKQSLLALRQMVLSVEVESTGIVDDWPTRALLLIAIRPDLSATKIAEEVGVHRTTLYKNKTVKRALKDRRGGKVRSVRPGICSDDGRVDGIVDH